MSPDRLREICVNEAIHLPDLHRVGSSGSGMSVVAQQLRLRNYLLIHVSFRRRLLRSLLLLLFGTGATFILILLQDAVLEASRDRSRLIPHVASSSVVQPRGRPLEASDCRAWLPLSSGQYDFSPVRSCALESALAHAGRYPVCLLLDRFDFADLSDFHWIKPLRKKYPGRLETLSPNYASVFSSTIFEDFHIDLDDHEFLQPAALWALLWKFGGLVISPTTILLKSLSSYYDFVWPDPDTSELSLGLFQLSLPGHELVGQILNRLMKQAKGHDDHLFFDETDFTFEVSSFCGGHVPPAKSFCGSGLEILEHRALRTVELRDLNRMAQFGTDNITMGLQVQESYIVPDSFAEKTWLKAICPITFRLLET